MPSTPAFKPLIRRSNQDCGSPLWLQGQYLVRSLEKPPAKKQANDDSFEPSQGRHLITGKAKLVLEPQESISVSEDDCTNGLDDPILHRGDVRSFLITTHCRCHCNALFTPPLWSPLGSRLREGRQEPRRNASGCGAVPTSPKQKN